MSDRYGLDVPNPVATPQGQRPNKFPGWCMKCRQPVAVGEGTIHRDVNAGKWKTMHIECPPQAVVLTAEPQVVPATVMVDLVTLTGSIHEVRHSKKTLKPECGCPDLAAKVWSHLGGAK